MEIQCECGSFRAVLKAFPQNSPGRLKCYCDDCQSYVHFLKRADILDENGGTEIIPAYPADVQIVTGKEKLKCIRLTDKGMFRFATTCCNTPVGNTAPHRPWLGIFRRVYNVQKLDQTFGEIKSSIMGKYAKGTPPKGTPQKFDIKGFAAVMPYLLKGKVMGKAKNSPFFEKDGVTPIVKPHVLSADERQAARAAAQV